MGRDSRRTGRITALYHRGEWFDFLIIGLKSWQEQPGYTQGLASAPLCARLIW
jgi:hypothetical protein